MFEFIVYTEKIMGKARPRFSNGRIFTPKTTQDHEELIKRTYLSEGGPHFGVKFLKMEVLVYFSVPKSATKTEREAKLIGKVRPGKPDADNILKLLADSLNGVAYDDDKQISTMICRKFYGQESKLIIRLSEDTDFCSKAV